MTAERIFTQATPVPVPYVRRFDFTSYQAANPSSPLPGTSVDAELNAVQLSLTATQARLAQIQNDDGSLGNEAVGREQIDPVVFTMMSGGFKPRGQWLTATSYVASDAVNMDGILWACVVAHVSSGNFAADRVAGDWMFIDQPVAAVSIPCNPIAASPVNNVQMALDYLATEVLNLKARVAALENAP